MITCCPGSFPPRDSSWRSPGSFLQSVHPCLLVSESDGPLQIVKSAPTTTSDGGYSYFEGGLIHYDIEHTAERYVARQIFKADNKHTGKGRGSTAVPPYHYHPYQDEQFTVVSPSRTISGSPSLLSVAQKGGTLCYVVNDKEGQLYKGESMTSPAGDRHTVCFTFVFRRAAHDSPSFLSVLVPSRCQGRLGCADNRDRTCQRTWVSFILACVNPARLFTPTLNICQPVR